MPMLAPGTVLILSPEAPRGSSSEECRLFSEEHAGMCVPTQCGKRLHASPGMAKVPGRFAARDLALTLPDLDSNQEPAG